MIKKVVCLSLIVLTYGSYSEEKSETNDESYASLNGSFLNVKASHFRSDNSYPFGPDNSSMVCANPFLIFGDVTIDSDFSYGRSGKYEGFLKSPTGMSRITGNLPNFFRNSKKIRTASQKGFENTVDKPHFYRNYSRIVFNDKKHDIKIIAGDVTTRNTIGFQQFFSGGGINISRQGGNGNVVNPGLPIVITKLTKAEVRLNGEILRVVLLAPGTYSVDDFGEEARLPGATIKLSDQLSRSEMLTVDYFSGYDMPEFGKDDFDFTVAFAHYWNVDDPYKIRYKNKPRYSGNYRFTPIENVTFAVGGQFYDNSYSCDFNVIFMTEYGKISPNIGFTDTYKSKKAAGAGIYYALPKNCYGVHFETFLSAKGRGYGDLSKSEENNESFDQYMDRYFPTLADTNGLKNGISSPENSRSIIARIYSDPIYGFTPAFIFRGEWANDHEHSTQRLREYSVSLNKTLFKGCSVTVIAGLTYDDPSKGRNQESPDRRLGISCNMDLNSEVSLKGTYSHMDGERMRKYASVTYTPEQIKGLEFCGEYTRTPGRSTPLFSVKYDNEYFGVKAEESIASSYEDERAATRNGHKNSQLFVVGTSLTAKGFRSEKRNSFNVIRVAEDFKK